VYTPPSAPSYAPGPAQVPADPTYTPGQPPATGAGQGGLQPGAGRPMVEGPPMSVGGPIRDTTINTGAAVMLGIGVIVVVLILALVVLGVCVRG
jgi:hypothetical protein